MSALPAPPAVPAGSIAAMMRALPAGTQPPVGFRDAACATLRLTRARGRVECDALGIVFEDDKTSDDRRTLILDLLASAGTPEAQIVMRRLLALGIARRDSRTFASFVQRLGFMERPDGATLRFLISVYGESKHEAHEVRAACAYALGAGAGRAHVWGLTDAAMRALEVLRYDLLRATSAAEKCALVTALGNAGLDSDVSVILRFVEDAESRVRGAAALALKKMHTSEARASLLALLTSKDENVAESALSALFEQTLARDELVRLAELVLAGRTTLALDGRILRLLVTQKLHVLGQVASQDANTLEDAQHLLLSRIEAQAMRARKVAERPLLERQSPSSVQVWEVANASGPARRASARMVPMPKSPLPYSAGYSIVSHEDWSSVPDTLKDQELAVAMGLALSATESAAPIAPPRRTITPAAQRAIQCGSAFAESSWTSRDSVQHDWTPSSSVQQTLMHGSMRELDSAPISEVRMVLPDPPQAPESAVANLRATDSSVQVKAEIRTVSAVAVPRPIVPLAVIC